MRRGCEGRHTSGGGQRLLVEREAGGTQLKNLEWKVKRGRSGPVSEEVKVCVAATVTRRRLSRQDRGSQSRHHI